MIWADIVAGDAAKKEVKNLQQQIDTRDARSRADSIAQRGRTVDCATCMRKLPEAQANERTALLNESKWRNKYGNANTERWIWRGLAVVAAYFGVKSL